MWNTGWIEWNEDVIVWNTGWIEWNEDENTWCCVLELGFHLKCSICSNNLFENLNFIEI